MEKDITQRWKYIGGSDVPAIMGISPFKTRWELLQEKAQIVEPSFKGNEYTEYGNVMEPKIREHCCMALDRDFEEEMQISGDIRYNADGWEYEHNELLEIKTTSQIHDEVEDYKVYLVQLLAGMTVFESKKGYLAVYERPDDFNEDFDPNRLTIFTVNMRDYVDLLDEIWGQIDRFRNDLKRLKENPFMTEEELQPAEIQEYANAAVILEQQLSMAKAIQDEAKETKAKLKAAMEKYGIKSWEMPNGTKITLVPDGNDTIQEKFNVEKFKSQQPDMFQRFVEASVKPGRNGYVRITLK